MSDRYIPMHHPLCSCELCMLLPDTDGFEVSEDVRRRAVAYLRRNGKPVRVYSAPEMDGMVGKTVRFQWAHRTPDLNNPDSVWNTTHEAHVQAVDRGALLLDPKTVGPRWWPFKAFSWIEVKP